MFRLYNQNTTIIQNIQNGTLNSKHAMPQKDITSNNESSFAMGRQEYMQSTPLNVGKKWYGGSVSRDSSAILKKRAIVAIGKGSVNLAGKSLSFAGHNDVNTTRDALSRVRNLGCAVPAKCRFKNMDPGAFF
jgi:hypothetical protein